MRKIVASFALLWAASSCAHASGESARAARKKSGLGVTVAYRIDGTPRLGHVTPVVLHFDGVSGPHGAVVQLSTDPGLSVQTRRELAVPAGKRTTVVALVSSDRKGLSYLHVAVTDGGDRSVTSILVQTEPAFAAMQPSGEPRRDPQGDGVVAMPAR